MQPGTEKNRHAYKISEIKYRGKITFWEHKYRHMDVDLKLAEYKIMN
jgi:hypothetical protein